eukprot:jgi/Mesen1/4528/ME000230S03666
MLSQEQRDRIARNREAAIARRTEFNHRPIYGASKDDGGWRTFAKRPAYSELQSPRTRMRPATPLAQVVPYAPQYRKAAVSSNPSENIPQLSPSPQQMRALKAVEDGKSLFITGSAGVGKSFLLGLAIRILRLKYGKDAVFVTASTGLAACSIGGTTLHSFAGVGLAQDSKDVLVDKATSRRETKNRWQKTQALVIDEISMIDADFFEKLEYIARAVRQNNRPFGNIQLLVTGDFYQLPPVSKGSREKNFAFEAKCWKQCFQMQVELTQVFRQADQEFIGLLNDIRTGNCSPATHRKLLACRNTSIAVGDGIDLTRLYPHKVDVGKENSQKLAALEGPEMAYTAVDDGRSEYAIQQLENTRTEKVLMLRPGAQVLLLKNINPAAGLANGARGVVVGFCSPEEPLAVQQLHLAPAMCPYNMWPVVRFACDQSEHIIVPESWTIVEGHAEIAKRWQVPLALAWAISVHKCQGMTLDRVESDLSKAFDYGMVYVALSRVRSLEGLRLTGFDPKGIKVHPKVAQYYNQLKEESSKEQLAEI